MPSSFTDPLHRLFNHSGLRRFLLRLRIPIVVALVAVWPWWLDQHLFWAGVAVTLFGEAIQVWCFACLEKEKVLTIRGPYQLCRNPMYLGRYFLILGFIVATGSAIAAAVYTACYWFYMVNRVKREEPVLERIFGDPYRDYLRDVNRFMPGIKRLNREFWFFDWNIMLFNNGHLNLLSVIVGYAYLWGMANWVVTWL
jgi:protein-S-isoprenylcysteine O-methyltransferase Ste14